MGTVIEGLDPLMSGQTMYSPEESPLRLRRRLIDQVPNNTSSMAPRASKIPNGTAAEQDEIAAGRVEKPAKVVKLKGKIKE